MVSWVNVLSISFLEVFLINNWIEGIFFEQILYYMLHVVIWCFIIAVRYGFCSEMRYLMMRSSR